MTASEFAAWVLAHLELDVWFTEATLRRRLAGIQGQRLTAERLLQALVAARWVTAHPTYPATWCLPARCWCSERPKPQRETAEDATPSGSESAQPLTD